jgi:hypothetical protein
MPKILGGDEAQPPLNNILEGKILKTTGFIKRNSALSFKDVSHITKTKVMNTKVITFK